MNTPTGRLRFALLCLVAARTCLGQVGNLDAPPDATSVIVDQNGGLIAELSTEQKVATLKTRFSRDEDTYLWLLNFSGPFDSDNSSAVVGDLDGLKGSATAEVGYQRILFESRQKITFSAKAGSKSFKYADATNLASDLKEQKTGYEIATTWSRFFEGFGNPKRGALFGIKLRYQQVYKAAGDYQLCTPIVGTTASQCRTTGSAAPTKSEPFVAQAQYAFLASKNIGIALTASHDFESNITGVELPVYLVRDDKTGVLNGGIKLSWQSDTDETSVILFIGLPLGTF